MALDPQSATRDYIRTDFTVENGLPSNVINAIVQTRNGFLWVGTDAGLVRFNGRRFIAVELRPPHRAQGSVRALVEGPDGALWVGTGAGLARHTESGSGRFRPIFNSNFSIQRAPVMKSLVCVLHRTARCGLARKADSTDSKTGRFESVLSGVIVNRIEKAADGHLLVLTTARVVEWDGARLAEDGALTGQLTLEPIRSSTSLTTGTEQGGSAHWRVLPGASTTAIEQIPSRSASVQCSEIGTQCG